MARRAESRIRASLHRVPRDEAGPVKAGERDLVEREPRRQRRNRRDPVACGAGSLRVAARAEVASACGPSSMLAQPVAVVNEMARGRRILRSEILVATVAVTKGPLIVVLVAAEAGSHLGPDHVWALFRDGLVAPDTIAMRRYLVSAVLEAKVLSRETRSFPGPLRAVAAKTRMLIVRLRVAAAACRIRRKVQRLDVTRGGDALVALDAIDPVGRVCAVLEGVRRLTRAYPEHPSARSQGQRREDKERERELHCTPQLRERRART